MGRTKRAISELYEELKERAKEVGLIINEEKNKSNGAKQETWKGKNTDCWGSQY
jgi:shikimate 5-dehydrogenase